jgi:hypothetical protein
MAISVRVLTSGGSSFNRSEYTTAEIDPVADELVLLFCTAAEEDDAYPAVTGLGQTWEPAASVANSSGVNMQLACLYCQPSSTPTPGTVVMDWGDNQANSIWAVLAVSGVVVGNNGADAIAQILTDESEGSSASAAAVALAAFADAANRAIAGFFIQLQRDVSPGADFTELTEDNPGGENGTLQTEWRSDAADTNPDVTWTGGATNWNGIALEVVAAAEGTTVTPGTASLTLTGFAPTPIENAEIPDEPANVVASPGTAADEIDVSWDAVAGADQVNVYYSTVEAGPYFQEPVPGDATSVTLTGLAAGTWFVRVTAENQIGESGYSSTESTSTPTPTVVTIPKATLTLTGFAPSVGGPLAITVPLATLALTGFAPSVGGAPATAPFAQVRPETRRAMHAEL